MSETQTKIINDIVRNYMLKNTNLVSKIPMSEEVINHVVQTGSEILAKKWGLIEYTGSFVNAIHENSLVEVFAKSDEINEQFIKFYVMLRYNVGYPNELLTKNQE
jgi:hypothetical protein